jgi:hypothetical protein
VARTCGRNRSREGSSLKCHRANAPPLKRRRQVAGQQILRVVRAHHRQSPMHRRVSVRDLTRQDHDLRLEYQWGSAPDHQATSLTCINSGTDRTSRKLTQGPAVKIGRPPPPAAPRSGRRKRPVVPPQSGWSGLRLQIWSGRLRRYAARKLDSSVQKLATKDRQVN